MNGNKPIIYSVIEKLPKQQGKETNHVYPERKYKKKTV